MAGGAKESELPDVRRKDPRYILVAAALPR